MNKRTIYQFILLTVLLVCLLLLTACENAEEVGRNFGKTLRDFWNGFAEGCTGSAFLPMAAGVFFLVSGAKARRK